MTPIYVELESTTGVLHLIQPALVADIQAGGQESGEGRRSYSILWIHGRPEPIWVRGNAREIGNILEKAFLTRPGLHREQTEEAH